MTSVCLSAGYMEDLLVPDICEFFCVWSAGCRSLQDLEMKLVEVDSCGDAQSAAEGAVLGLFHYDQLKFKKKTKVTPKLHGRQTDGIVGHTEFHRSSTLTDKCSMLLYMCLCVIALSADLVGWEKGVMYAEGQNLARLLMEAPANHITPTAFAKTIEEKLAPHAERVTIQKRFVHH